LPSIPRLEGVLRRTTHETVLETLRKAILDGVLESGTPLVQADLSELLGVSKTPIREAIRDLAAEGLIDFDSYRSSVVHTPTLAEALEIYELRLTLEPLEIEKSVGKIPQADLDRAAELQLEMEKVDEVSRWIEMNREFHGLLSAPELAPRLHSIIVGLRNASAIQVAWSLKANPALLGRANGDHAEIIDAYRRADVEAAVEFSKHHLRATLEAIQEQEAAVAEGDVGAQAPGHRRGLSS
jgi:DNA-binding GntR family transcriptional regulator